VSAQVWVTDMAEFAEMNEVWDAWVSPQHPPVRAAVQAVLARPEWKVEMMVIAALPES
ncbi:Rid family hydrolase, partial [Chryseobacterium sp. SIMBA_028]